jgi:hypothetical protein
MTIAKGLDGHLEDSATPALFAATQLTRQRSAMSGDCCGTGVVTAEPVRNVKADELCRHVAEAVQASPER